MRAHGKVADNHAIVLDSGADTSAVSMDWAVNFAKFSMKQLKKGDPTPVTAQYAAWLEQWPKEDSGAENRQVFKGYKNEFEISIGKSGVHKVPIIIYESEGAKPKPVLGREAVFDHFYFALGTFSTGPLDGPDLRVWDQSQLNWKRTTQGIPEALITANGREPVRVGFDSGAELTILDLDSAQSQWGVDCQQPPIYERAAVTLSRVIKTKEGYENPGIIHGPLKKAVVSIAENQFELWCLFRRTGSKLPPILGCASVLENYLVGFGCGPTLWVPQKEISQLGPWTKG